jgi:ribonuclease HI
MLHLKDVTIYTDGACSGNPGPGGWGAVLIYGQQHKELSGYMPETTNNRMELFAAIQALSALKQPCSVRLHSDSAYLVNAATQGWLENWQQNGWKTAAKQPVENQDLWRLLLRLMAQHEVAWVKVRGHADDVWNNRCDALATAQIRASGADAGNSDADKAKKPARRKKKPLTDEGETG